MSSPRDPRLWTGANGNKTVPQRQRPSLRPLARHRVTLLSAAAARKLWQNPATLLASGPIGAFHPRNLDPLHYDARETQGISG